ncbi:amino acid synthesis protein [Ancylobacter aquaticus]|uniref:Amino acid synthesis protein n=1 Tax=Ancylobacter aquaticus TaxID=100 RepID=A0A4R1I8A7_ANCAQ|nr:amino acid synthesis family protein [Ancylobacter aquaticus]TCK30391.1 amino acid synthesis protein [Ancylobacter aquaticus]
MSAMQVRKIVVQLEETHSEIGKAVSPPSRKVTIAAVITNPFAGKHVEELAPLYDLGAEVSALLAERGLEILGVGPEAIQNYGKAAIVGTEGEIEHAAALLHPKFGAPVRSAVAGKDIIPSTKKIGAPGAAITFPLTGKTSIWDFDQMDAAEITIPDAPRANEVVVILALGIGGRPLHRIKLPA